MPRAQPKQQLTLQDSQMLQRQLMLKQFQELQRQQNYLNQQPENFRSANTSFMPHGSSVAFQEFPSGIFSQPQKQDLFLTPPHEQLVESLSRTPTGSSVNSYSQYSHLQGLSSESAIAFTKGSNNQAEKTAMLYGRPFLGVNHNISPDLRSFTDGTFQAKEYPNGKNLFPEIRNEGSQLTNTSSQEFNNSQEHTHLCEQFHGKTTNIDLSQGSTTLDPLEQKILFNMDGNSWSSFGSNTEGYTNTLECSDYLSAFPSIQSGSWSALMQTAVAESSSDNGVVQEEWSGLSFQNTEPSMDNQPSFIADVGNQQTDWVDNNVPSFFNGKPQTPFSGIDMNLGFSRFQPPNKQREGTRSDSSHESVQQLPQVASKWLDGNPQQGQLIKGSQQNHAIHSSLGNAFPFQGFQISDDNANQRSTFAKSHDQTSIPPSFGSSMQGNHNETSAAGPDCTRNLHHQQHSSAAAVETQSPLATSPNVGNKLLPFDLFIPRSASHSSPSRDQVGQHFSILEAAPVESSRKAPSQWPNTSSRTRPSGEGPGELPSDWQLSPNLTNTNPQAPLWVSQDQHDQKILEGNPSHEPGVGLTNPQGLFGGKEDHDKLSEHERAFSEVVGQTTPQTGLYPGLELVVKHLSEETGVGSGTLTGHPQQMNFDSARGGDKQVPSVSARDLEAFGRSLKPSNLHPNYSCSEIAHELGSVSVPNASPLVDPYAFREVNVQSIQPSSLPVLQNTAEQMRTQGVSFSGADLNVSDVAFHRTGNAQANMQMASWFKQYGTLRNGQMLSMYDRTTINNMHRSPLGKPSENLEMETSIVPLDVIGDSQDADKQSPPSTIPPDLVDADLSVTRSKKRKIATSNLIPWYAEVAESSKRLQSISMAEMNWAKAVNRLVDKVDYGVKIEDVDPLIRPKKRLVLTTQLMQLIFMPAPAAILRAKAALNYDSVAYFSAKLALGDACNLNSWSRNRSGFPCTGDNVMTESSKPNEKMSEKCFPTIVEDFTSRAKKLEANLLRFEKTASVLNVIVEYKELEKFSIINRFAKFHVRGQPVASTSSGSTPSLINPAPQRYVLALRAGTLPEKAHCLAL